MDHCTFRNFIKHPQKTAIEKIVCCHAHCHFDPARKMPYKNKTLPGNFFHSNHLNPAITNQISLLQNFNHTLTQQSQSHENSI